MLWLLPGFVHRIIGILTGRVLFRKSQAGGLLIDYYWDDWKKWQVNE